MKVKLPNDRLCPDDSLVITGRDAVDIRIETDEEISGPNESVKRFRHEYRPTRVTYEIRISQKGLLAMVERAANNKTKLSSDGPIAVRVVR